MTYTENMLNTEDKNKEKIVLRANRLLDTTTIFCLRRTKALLLEDISMSNVEYLGRTAYNESIPMVYDKPMRIQVTTWSSLMRSAVDLLRPDIEAIKMKVSVDKFKETFEVVVNDICKDGNYTLNSNCPRRLFKKEEEAELIHSTVYMNSANHLIPIITDENNEVWYLCAVYTGEVIIMLEALLQTIYDLTTQYVIDVDVDKFSHHTFVITYVNRLNKPENLQGTSVKEQGEIGTEIADMNEELLKLKISNNLIQIQKKLINLQFTLVELYKNTEEIYKNVEDIQRKYDLKTMEDLIGM